MARTRHQPAVLAVGFAAGLLVSATACALITSAAPVAATSEPAAVSQAARIATAPAPDRDPFAPLVDVSKLP